MAAGKLDWWEAWAYVTQAFIIIVFSRAILLRKNPDLARERALREELPERTDRPKSLA